jgi:hypothetical protein
VDGLLVAEVKKARHFLHNGIKKLLVSWSDLQVSDVFSFMVVEDFLYL